MGSMNNTNTKGVGTSGTPRPVMANVNCPLCGQSLEFEMTPNATIGHSEEGLSIQFDIVRIRHACPQYDVPVKV